ncbi:PREDICTED: zinc finger and BTB domain-containing protein 4 [Thamnophis sirtalis]|uniref:Zinc finger and BTB domain-containing protein 4 n=1 Tax=Thamnophis sirtalis TaxID=35019 RepID=A0A6I9YYM2_9SAUR|nr:PREDICTED: zinc finger and BTB domain-containing protein 4 [Thamnophis sirtalis]
MASVVELTDNGHSTSLLIQLNEQRLRGQFCDITIIAEDTKFKAHKNILAASSPYFKEVLSEESACRHPSQILELPDIQAKVFSDILNFIYNSRLSVPSPAVAKEIGAVGRRLGISRLENLDDPLAEVKMDSPGMASPRGCSSPIDLTYPSRSTEAPSPVCLQNLTKVYSPGQDPRPDSETETAKILYNLSSVATVPPAVSSDLTFMLKETVGWDHNLSGTPPAASVNTNDGAPASASSSPASPSGASYPASSTFCCGSCNRSFTTSSALGLHVKLHRTRRSLSCRHCGKSFIHIKRLQTHEVLCKEGEKPKEGGSADQPPASPELPSKPTVAAAASSKKAMLFRHRGPPRVDYLSDQDHFVKVVDGHIIYFCTVCERSYMTLSSLKRHSNVHSWRRKYPCRYCDKVFALAEYRTKHEVWHTGERRYQCIFCWETFVTYYNLKTHQKAFHGINPGLISSEKTPNGGYKPKLNALKLYRLLPMRSQKRPYKTYSQAVVPEDLLHPAHAVPMTLGEGDSLDGNLVSSLSASEVASVFTTKNASLELPEADQGHPQETTNTQDMSVLSATGEEGQLDKPPRSLSTEAPTVIAYGHPTSSVIVHSTSVKAQAPSVITYNSTSSSAPLNAGSPPSLSAPSPVVTKPIKKQVLREYIQSQKMEEQASEEDSSEQGFKARGSRSGRTMTYMAKPACVGAASESRAAPLCQITVRIGEEAIVKRRISETDLMLDKSSRAGGRRLDFGRDQSAEKPHHALLPATLHGKRAERVFVNDSGEEDSDRGDTEDQLWRPYYSYKPKRKAGGSAGSGAGNALPKMKKQRWRHKLRSLRWMKRSEETKEGSRTGPHRPGSAEVSGGQEAASDRDEMDQPIKVGGGRGTEWKHKCGICGKLFSALKKLRKHERVHGRLAKDDQALAVLTATPHRVGRKPLLKFACAHCTKVCKTAAALSRHMKRHEGQEEAPLPVLTTVIAYSKKATEVPLATPPPVVKEETTQEMQVSSSSGEAPGGQAEAPEEGCVEMEPCDGHTLGPLPEDENLSPQGADKSPFHEEVPAHSPPLQATTTTTSLADLPPDLPHSLQDPVISHTGLVQKEILASQEMEGDRYPVQEYPLPLLVPGSCRSRKDVEDKPSFLAYPSAIQFNAVGKAGSSSGDGKVSFYPEPYPLMYGHQLLAAYPYNFTLPVALNMVIPDDKGQPLPFLPNVFSYSMNPCRGVVGHEGPPASHGGLGMGSSAREGRGEPAAPERLKKGGLL